MHFGIDLVRNRRSKTDYFPPLLPPPEELPDVFCPDPMDGTQLTDAFLDKLGFVRMVFVVCRE